MPGSAQSQISAAKALARLFAEKTAEELVSFGVITCPTEREHMIETLKQLGSQIEQRILLGARTEPMYAPALPKAKVT
jgi:hypothetical protein